MKTEMSVTGRSALTGCLPASNPGAVLSGERAAAAYRVARANHWPTLVSEQINRISLYRVQGAGVREGQA